MPEIFEIDSSHSRASGIIPLDLSILASPESHIVFHNSSSNPANKIFIEVVSSQDNEFLGSEILSKISVEGPEADLVFVSHVEGLSVVGSNLENIVSFTIEEDISLLIPLDIQEAFFDVLDNFLDLSKSKLERAQFKSLVSDFVRVNNKVVFLITQGERLEKFQDIVLSNGDFADEICSDLYFLSQVLYQDYSAKIASWFIEHLSELTNYHKTFALKTLNHHPNICNAYMHNLFNLLEIESVSLKSELEREKDISISAEELDICREYQKVYKDLIFDILNNINIGISEAKNLEDVFIEKLADFVKNFLSKTDKFRVTESVINILSKIDNHFKIDKILKDANILEETVKVIVNKHEKSTNNTMLLIKIFRIIDNSSLEIDKNFAELIVSSVRSISPHDNTKDFFLQFIYLYSKILSSLDIQNLNIDTGILESLQQALILQSNESKRSEIRGVLLNIVAVYPELAPKVFDFFKGRFFSIYERGGDRNASNSEYLIYINELTKIIEKVDIPLDRVLSERLFTLALDHTISIDVRTSATELLELALSFDSGDKSVRFIKFFSGSVSLPLFLQSLDRNGDLDETPIMLLNYLESVFVHGSISYGMFKQYLETIGEYSAFASSLYKNLFDKLSDSDLSNMGVSKSRHEILTRMFKILESGDKVKEITSGLERSLEYYVKILSSDENAISEQFHEREKILNSLIPRLEAICVCIKEGIDLSPKIYFFISDILKVISDNAVSNISIFDTSKNNKAYIGAFEANIEVLKFAVQNKHSLPFLELSGSLEVLLDVYNKQARFGELCENIEEILEFLAKIESVDVKSKSLPKIISEFDISNVKDIKQEYRFFDSRIIEEIKNIHNMVFQALEKPSILPEICSGFKEKEISTTKISEENISDWSDSDILSWSKAFCSYREALKETNSLSKLDNASITSEILSVITRSNEIITGQIVRSTQLFSVISFIKSNSSSKPGLLLEIKTGEGKSTITRMSAATLALLGQKVDIVTSSPILAERDHISAKSFFEILNLTSGYNPSGISGSSGITEHNFLSYKKELYKKDIIYGDTGSFESDIIRDMEGGIEGKLVRGDRGLECLILDEVDSMLLDERGKSTMLAKHISGMEYLEPVLCYIWYQTCNLEQQIIDQVGGGIEDISSRDLYKFKLNQLRSFASKAEEFLNIPLHLKEYVDHMWDSWVKSALGALSKVRDIDYVIKINGKGHSVVAPVDFTNTGIVQTSLNWSNGLHQFLQLKHNLRLTPEGFITSFLSHVNYFKGYGNNIYGMTGTLGGESTKEMLHEIYNVNLGLVPTYKEKQFTELPGTVSSDEEEWQQNIILDITNKAQKKRSVLVIVRSIADVNLLYKALQDSGYSAGKIKVYSRDDGDQKDVIKEVMGSGDIILATNLAGRGTDIKLSRDVVENGGLHVIVGFVPSNQRVEDQGFGRAARGGEPGSGCMIVKSSELISKYHMSENKISSMSHDMGELFDHVKGVREELEKEALDKSMKELLPQLNLKYELYRKFCELHQELKSHENNRIKLSGLKERWGIFLNEVDQKFSNLDLVLEKESEGLSSTAKAEMKSKKIEDIITKYREEFDKLQITLTEAYKSRLGDSMLITTNPSLWIEEAYKRSESGRYSSASSLMESASKIDSFFAAAAYYNHAYFLIQDGYRNVAEDDKEGKVKYKSSAIEALGSCETSVNGMISLLETMYMSENGESDGVFGKHVNDKIKILKQLKSSSSAIRSILERNLIDSSAKDIAIKDIKPTRDCLGGDFDESDIDEFNIYGIKQFFEVEERLSNNSHFGAFFKATLGALEIAAGIAFLATGNIGMAITAFKMGCADIMSAHKISIGEESFSMKEFLSERGSEIFVQIAFSVTTAMAAALKEGRNLLQAGKDWAKQSYESAKQAFDFASSAGGSFLASGSFNTAMAAGASSIGKDTLHIANYAKEFAIEMTKDVVLEKTMEYGVDLVIKEYQNSHAEKLEEKLVKEIEPIIKSREDRLIKCILIDLISSGKLLSLVKGGDCNIDNALFANKGLGTKYISKLESATAKEIRENEFMISKAVQQCCNVISGAVSKLESASAGAKLTGNIAKTIGAIAVPAESYKQLERFSGKLESALGRSLDQIIDFGGNEESLGTHMIKESLYTKLKEHGVIKARIDELYWKLEEAGIIQKGRVVGMYPIDPSELEEGHKSSDEKLDEIFGLKPDNNLRIFRALIYLVREILISLEHAFDDVCLAVAKDGVESLKNRIVKDARSEIHRKMRNEVINSLAKPVIGALGSSWASDSKSKYVLSEAQVQEAIAERREVAAKAELEAARKDAEVAKMASANHKDHTPEESVGSDSELEFWDAQSENSEDRSNLPFQTPENSDGESDKDEAQDEDIYGKFTPIPHGYFPGKKDVPLSESDGIIRDLEAQLPNFIKMIERDIEPSPDSNAADNVSSPNPESDEWNPLDSTNAGMRSSEASVIKDKKGVTRFKDAESGKFNRRPDKELLSGGGEREGVVFGGIDYQRPGESRNSNTQYKDLHNNSHLIGGALKNLGPRIYVKDASSSYMLIERGEFDAAMNAGGSIGLNLASVRGVDLGGGKVHGDIDVMSARAFLGFSTTNAPGATGVSGNVGAMSTLVSAKMLYESPEFCLFTICAKGSYQIEAGIGAGFEVGGEAKIETGEKKGAKFGLKVKGGAGAVVGEEFSIKFRTETLEEIEFKRNKRLELTKEIHKQQEEIMKAVKEENKK